MSIEVRNIKIGDGKPKITVQIKGSDADHVLADSKLAYDSPADILEWRVDTFNDWKDEHSFLFMLKKVRTFARDKVLLFTFRTVEEGGTAAIRDQEYIHLLKTAIESGCIDMVDIECCVSEYRAMEVIPLAKERGVIVLGSNHSQKKISDAEMESRIRYMQRLGADTVKMTVCVSRKKEVLELLNMTYALSSTLEIPITIVGKGPFGKNTRAFSEFFGNAFVCGVADMKENSDEISVYRLSKLLDSLHSL